MRISDWSSDVCSSDLADLAGEPEAISAPGYKPLVEQVVGQPFPETHLQHLLDPGLADDHRQQPRDDGKEDQELVAESPNRSEEHTSELQSLMRISYAVFCLKKKKDLTLENILYFLCIYLISLDTSSIN